MTTPYRNEVDALRERKTALESEIAKLREQATGLDALRAREAEVARELEAVDARLRASGATRRPLPLLDQVRVASPCKADWNEMLGDERVRFCLGCEKNVYNLSSMAKDAAEALLRERLGNDLCVRFYQRADGTILTQDCPVGVSKKRRRKLVLAVAGAGAMAAAAATMFVRGTTSCTKVEGVATAGSAMYEPAAVPMMGDYAPTPPIPTEVTEVKGEVAPTTGVVGPARAEAHDGQAEEADPSEAAHDGRAAPADRRERSFLMGRGPCATTCASSGCRSRAPELRHPS